MSAVQSNRTEPAVTTGVVHQVRELLGALRSSAVAKKLAGLTVGIVIVLAFTVYAQIELNSWNKPFYDAISRRDLRDFFVQLGIFAVIAGVLLVFNVAQRWLVETLQLRMREALVTDLVGLWMQPRRAFWLEGSGPMGAHPDQRMHDDALKLCEMSAALGVGLLQATMLFLSFAGVLWGLSKDFSIPIDGKEYAIPGFMLWAAILYAIAGSLLSYWVGKGLIVRNAERYAREGELRFSLTRISEHLDGISLAAGEADEKRRVAMHLGDVLQATSRVILGLTNLTWVTAGFGGVGKGLIVRNAERYAREGELRFSLTRISEHLDGISLAAGEADEKRRVAMHLGDVLQATSRVILGLTNLTWVTAGFGWVTVIAPTLVAAPLYFSGKVSFGGLMMAAAAFTQAQSSLRWFVDNFSAVADWRAALLRVSGLRQVLSTDLEAQQRGSRITYVEGEPGTLGFEALEVRAWTGHDRLDEADLTLRAGHRLLILGTPGTEKTLLFRALAGLWPWGSGTVHRPGREHIYYMPRGTPYLPRGTLAEALSYPMEPSSYSREAMTAALAGVGLQRLEALLDKRGRWERELSIDEQLLLGFARVVLQAPPWLVMDDAFGAFDDDTLERIINVLDDALPRTGIVHIGSAGEAHDRLFTHVVHLVKAPGAQEPRP